MPTRTRHAAKREPKTFEIIIIIYIIINYQLLTLHTKQGHPQKIRN